MSKTTTLLLVVALFATVAVQSVSSAAADVLTFTNGSFYKEKSAEKFVSQGDASLGDTVADTQLIGGKNSKTNYYIYQVSTPTNKDETAKGGSITINVRQVDVNKLAFAEGSGAVTVTGFKWDSSEELQYGASVKNNITVLGVLSLDPSAENIVQNLYAYLVDLDKNEKTEILIASGSYTDASTRTTVSLNKVFASGALTIILYSSTAVTATGSTRTWSLVTLKNGKLGTPTTVKTTSWTTGNSATESLSGSDSSGENVYVVYTTTANSLATQTVYHFIVSDKEIKAGTIPTAVLNTQVAETNTYSFAQIFGHAEGRWVALYYNQTESNDITTTNYVVKASNDTTGFKLLVSSVPAADGKTSVSYSVSKHFGGLLVLITDGSTSTGGTSIDQYTYSYQIYSGDFTPGTKTAFVTASGKYSSSDVTLYRVGDNKAVIAIVAQVNTNTTADPPTSTVEGLYYGQLFQKSFGATLQSVLAVCSLMLAALFIF